MAMTCGTHSTYVRGCRCTDCTAANRAYMAKYRQAGRHRMMWGSAPKATPGMASATIHRLFPRLLTPLELVDHGACRGYHDTFFLGDAARTDRLRYGVHQRQIAQAHAICVACPVLKVCRQWSLSAPDPVPYHYAADMTPRQRDAVRRGGDVEPTTKR